MGSHSYGSAMKTIPLLCLSTALGTALLVPGASTPAHAFDSDGPDISVTEAPGLGIRSVRGFEPIDG